jgi:acetyl esterase/lipase
VTFASLFTPHHPVRMHGEVAYGSAALETLDLCSPTDVSTPLPGIVLIHGGSSTIGDKRAEFDVQGDTLVDACMGLASQGFVVASINYRLAHADPWPAQVEDAQLAVRWLRAHAAELGIDPEHLCSVGLSSGAYLAVFLGTLTTTLPGDRAGDLVDQSPQVSCVADFYGPVDLASWITVSQENRDEVLDLLHQTTPKSNPSLYRTASPLYAVTSASAPMLIVQGTSDDTVPEAQSRALEAALKQRHVPVQYISYSGGHVFEGLDEEQVRAIWGQAVAFLAAH